MHLLCIRILYHNCASSRHLSFSKGKILTNFGERLAIRLSVIMAHLLSSVKPGDGWPWPLTSWPQSDACHRKLAHQIWTFYDLPFLLLACFWVCNQSLLTVTASEWHSRDARSRDAEMRWRRRCWGRYERDIKRRRWRSYNDVSWTIDRWWSIGGPRLGQSRKYQTNRYPCSQSCLIPTIDLYLTVIGGPPSQTAACRCLSVYPPHSISISITTPQNRVNYSQVRSTGIIWDIGQTK